MKISEAKKKAAFSVRLELGQYNQDFEGEYITLKEPSYEDMATLQQTEDDASAQTKWFSQALAGLIIDSSFEFENGKPAAAKDVAEIVLASADMTIKIVKDWTAACPFFSRNQNEEE